jgi:hypothetical protein
MPDNDSDHGVDEALEGEIVEDGAQTVAGRGPTSGDIWSRPGGVGDRPGPGPAGPTITPTAVKEGATRHRESSALTIGAVLVVVGAVLLAYRFSDTLAAGSAPLVIGLGFVTWWAVGGGFGLMVPGGVLSGIGVGLILEEAGFYGDAVPFGLGLGFLAIYVLDAVRRREWSRWWPLVPGVVLVGVGLFGDTSAWESLGGFGWPLILIAVGVVVLVVALSRRAPRR